MQPNMQNYLEYISIMIFRLWHYCATENKSTCGVKIFQHNNNKLKQFCVLLHVEKGLWIKN